LTAAFTPDPAR